MERDEQIAVVQFLRVKKIPFYAVPNGGSRHMIEAARMKQEGVSSGVPDLVIFLPTKSLYIEMKRKKGRDLNMEDRYCEYIPYMQAELNARAKRR